MKVRAMQNKLFVYIKIPEVPICVSYKGQKEKNNILDVASFRLQVMYGMNYFIHWNFDEKKWNCKLFLTSKKYANQFFKSVQNVIFFTRIWEKTRDLFSCIKIIFLFIFKWIEKLFFSYPRVFYISTYIYARMQIRVHFLKVNILLECGFNTSCLWSWNKVRYNKMRPYDWSAKRP